MSADASTDEGPGTDGTCTPPAVSSGNSSPDGGSLISGSSSAQNSPLMFSKEATDGSLPNDEPPGHESPIALADQKLSSLATPKNASVLTLQSLHKSKTPSVLMEVGSRVLALNFVDTSQRGVNWKSARFYVHDIIRKHPLFNVWQYFAVSSKESSWVIGTILWRKSAGPVPVDYDAYFRALPEGQPVEILGGLWSTNCGKLVLVVGNPMDGFIQFKDDPKMKLDDFICLNFLPPGVQIEDVVDAVYEMTYQQCLVYDKHRSEVQFRGRTLAFNEDFSAAATDCDDDESISATPIRFQGKSISLGYEEGLSVVQNDLGEYGRFFNVVKNGGDISYKYLDCVRVNDLKSFRPDRLLYLGCIEQGAPVDSHAKFMIFLYCSAQKILFTTTLSKIQPTDAKCTASKEIKREAEAIFVTHMQQLENATRLPRLKSAAELLPEAPATMPKKVKCHL